MSIEIQKAVGNGTVKIEAGKRVNIDGAIFQIEGVDMKSKKVTLGVVNIDAARAHVQQTRKEDVVAPKMSEKKPEPIPAPQPEGFGEPIPEIPSEINESAT